MAYFVYAESWIAGEPHAVLNQCSGIQEANDCVDVNRQAEDVVRVVLIEGKLLVDWTPESERELTTDDLRKSGLES